MTAGVVWLLAAALWLGAWLGGPWWLALLAPLLALVAAAIPTDARLPLVCVALALAGAGLAGGRDLLLDRGPLAELAAGGGQAVITATVVSEPRETERGVWLLVRADQVDTLATRERALVHWPDSDPPRIGERLTLLASARPLGREGFDRHARRLHAGTELAIVRSETATAPGWVMATTGAVRERSRAAIDARLDARRASLLAGLVLGDTTGRPAELTAAFAGAGLSHLVVVSGRHVAVLLAAVLALTALGGVGFRGRGMISLWVVAWFVVLVRWQPSVLRAGFMAGLVLSSRLLGRGQDVRHALGTAVVLLLFADPFLAGQLGFVMSVGATAGVLVLAPWLAAWLPGPRLLRLPMSVTVGAQVGAAPALLQISDGLPLLAVPANVLAVPAAGGAQVVGLIAAAVAQVSTAAGGVLAVCAHPFLTLVLWAAERFSTGPELRPEHLLTPVAVLLLLGLVVRRRAPAVALTTVVAVVVVGVWPAGPAAPVDTLTVTVLDVGQGDAVLVEIPDAGGVTRRLLMDGGPDGNRASRLLRDRGIRSLDLVALSHPHHDHSGGLPRILESFEVAGLLVGPTPLTPGDGLALSAVEAYAAAEQQGVRRLAVSAGEGFGFGRGWVEVLSPPADGALAHDLNEDSLVLRISDVHGSVLLTGDAEVAAQTLLLQRPERLRADVVKVPHHGGNTNATGFLDAVGAELAVIGVGENDYGHPHPAVLEDLGGTPVFRTDLHGTVTVRLTDTGPVVVADDTGGVTPARSAPARAAGITSRRRSGSGCRPLRRSSRPPGSPRRAGCEPGPGPRRLRCADAAEAWDGPVNPGSTGMPSAAWRRRTPCRSRTRPLAAGSASAAAPLHHPLVRRTAGQIVLPRLRGRQGA